MNSAIVGTRKQIHVNPKFSFRISYYCDFMLLHFLLFPRQCALSRLRRRWYYWIEIDNRQHFHSRRWYKFWYQETHHANRNHQNTQFSFFRFICCHVFFFFFETISRLSNQSFRLWIWVLQLTKSFRKWRDLRSVRSLYRKIEITMQFLIQFMVRIVGNKILIKSYSANNLRIDTPVVGTSNTHCKAVGSIDAEFG